MLRFSSPVRHGDDAVRKDDARLEHVHADAADGVVEVEQVAVLVWNLRNGSRLSWLVQAEKTSLRARCSGRQCYLFVTKAGCMLSLQIESLPATRGADNRCAAHRSRRSSYGASRGLPVHLEPAELSQWPPPLVGDVVDDEHAPRIRHLAVVPVMRLQAAWHMCCQAPEYWRRYWRV